MEVDYNGLSLESLEILKYFYIKLKKHLKKPEIKDEIKKGNSFGAHQIEFIHYQFYRDRIIKFLVEPIYCKDLIKKFDNNPFPSLKELEDKQLLMVNEEELELCFYITILGIDIAKKYIKQCKLEFMSVTAKYYIDIIALIFSFAAVVISIIALVLKQS